MTLIGTSKNCIIYYSIDGAIPHVFTGFSNENIITIPKVDILKATMGNDGALQKSIVAKHVEFEMNFWAASPSVNYIYKIQTFAYTTGQPVSGILVAIFPSLGVEYAYLDASFMSGPIGLEAGEEMKPVPIKVASLLPNLAAISALSQTVLSILT